MNYIAAQTPMGESTGIDVPGQLWTRFHKAKSELTEYTNPSIELGMSYIADSEKSVFKYFAGVLVQDKLDKPINDFILQELLLKKQEESQPLDTLIGNNMDTIKNNYILSILSGELLINSDMRITEIATHVGYPDYKRFSFYFLKYYNQSPREYRKSYLTRTLH